MVDCDAQRAFGCDRAEDVLHILGGMGFAVVSFGDLNLGQ